MYVCISVFGKFPPSVLNIYRNFYVWRASIHLISRHSFLHSMYPIRICVCKCVRDFISRSSWFVGIPIHLHARSKCNFYFCFTPFHSIFSPFCTIASLFVHAPPDFPLHWRPFVGPFAVDYLLLQTKKCNKKANAKKCQHTRNAEKKAKLHIHIRHSGTRNSCVPNETWKVVVVDDNFLSPYDKGDAALNMNVLNVSAEFMHRTFNSWYFFILFFFVSSFFYWQMSMAMACTFFGDKMWNRVKWGINNIHSFYQHLCWINWFNFDRIFRQIFKCPKKSQIFAIKRGRMNWCDIDANLREFYYNKYMWTFYFHRQKCNVCQGCQIKRCFDSFLRDRGANDFRCKDIREWKTWPTILINWITQPCYLDAPCSTYDVLTITTNDDSASVRYSISFNIYYWISNAITPAEKVWIQRIPNSVRTEKSKSEVWRRRKQ